jgi:uncharacterized membrane protein YbhN (UPF0104 family)
VQGIFDHLAGTTWYALLIGLVFHGLATVVRARAWRNVLADDFPGEEVRWRGILGAYAAGVGVNAVLPARLGDIVKLIVARRQVPAAGYPALISSLFVLTLLDSVFALGFVCWASWDGAMPGIDELERHPAAVGAWLGGHWPLTAAAAVLALAGLAAFSRLCRRRLSGLRAGFARGFLVLRDWRFLLGSVATWQGAGWVLQLAAFWWFLRAFELHASIHAAAVVQSVQSLAIAVPITPSGAGAEQALLIMAFQGKAAADAVVSFAVGMRVALILFDALAGVAAILLLLRTLRLHRLLHAEEQIHEHVGAWTAKLLLRRRRPAIRVAARPARMLAQPVVAERDARRRPR